MITILIDYIQAWYKARSIKKAIRLADQAARLTGRKHLVLMVKGKPKVYAKRDLSTMIRKRSFKKRTRIQDLERKALFITR